MRLKPIAGGWIAVNGRYALDTNVVISLFAKDPQVTASMQNGREIFIPIIVIGELYYGAKKSARCEENTAKIDEFVAENVILPCDLGTARQYSEIKDQLRHKGRPIPENDIWIAAIALQYQVTLVTRDPHFREIEGLVLEQW
jgi:tRNA(fMet)-specific endonuclease VapC